MNYYFYSEKSGIKGLLNYKRMKIYLFDSRQQAVEYAVEKYSVTKENPVGYIYSCAAVGMKQGENLNSGYKSDVPVQVTGCVPVENLL